MNITYLHISKGPKPADFHQQVQVDLNPAQQLFRGKNHLPSSRARQSIRSGCEQITIQPSQQHHWLEIVPCGVWIQGYASNRQRTGGRLNVKH